MLPSARACSYCSSISDAELTAFANHTLRDRGMAHLVGLGLVAAGFVLLLAALAAIGFSLAAGGVIALVGVVVGAGGAQRIESGKLYARLKHIDRFRQTQSESSRGLSSGVDERGH